MKSYLSELCLQFLAWKQVSIGEGALKWRTCPLEAMVGGLEVAVSSTSQLILLSGNWVRGTEYTKGSQASERAVAVCPGPPASPQQVGV